MNDDFSVSKDRLLDYITCIRPSQCFLRIWKMGSACKRDSCADHGRVRLCRPILANLKKYWVLVKNVVAK